MIALALKAWGFLGGVPKQVWLAIAIGAALASAMLWHDHKVSQAHKAAYSEGFKAANKLYDAALDKADAEATKHVATVVVGQSTISKGNADALDHSVTAIDARADTIRVRHDAATASRSQVVHLPASGEAPALACPTPAQDGLPWSVAFPLMTQAQKNLAQLNAVLDEVEAQDALAAEVPKP